MTDELKPLSKKHQRFVDEYLKCFNQTQAYLVVYPSKTTPEAARANAARLITKDNVQAEIKARLAEIHMSTDEALKLLADHARGDLGDFIDDYGGIDLTAARDAGKTRLLKKVETRVVRINGKDQDTETITTRVELHDPQSAIEKILKVHGKIKEPGTVIYNVKLTDD